MDPVTPVYLMKRLDCQGRFAKHNERLQCDGACQGSYGRQQRVQRKGENDKMGGKCGYGSCNRRQGTVPRRTLSRHGDSARWKLGNALAAVSLKISIWADTCACAAGRAIANSKGLGACMAGGRGNTRCLACFVAGASWYSARHGPFHGPRWEVAYVCIKARAGGITRPWKIEGRVFGLRAGRSRDKNAAMEGPMKRRGTATRPDGPKDPIGNRACVSTNEQKRSGGSKMNQDGTPNAPGRNVHSELTCLLRNCGLL
ncbi:hypothetical protein BDP55DRAFT_224697 [Colletotrichum godetiae]|uniref:Uncharacterized protein n=1 Tax=Colletotrichum godetiae TaxID=1209918 RepID=A0AAJ0AKM1_9PEZI|nr:uncharacterized protein BDP55DRAFT_224697 [Colletotrichum godetiae]KAK1673456.1 hypothetical protein BDP55DRAFT_224697 [Colletotrichum godetiae]